MKFCNVICDSVDKKKKEKKTLLKVKLIFREERELRSKRPVAIPSISSIANSPLQNPNQ